MSTHDNAPPLPDWVCEPRPCPLPDISRAHAERILARAPFAEVRIPKDALAPEPHIIRGDN